MFRHPTAQTMNFPSIGDPECSEGWSWDLIDYPPDLAVRGVASVVVLSAKE